MPSSIDIFVDRKVIILKDNDTLVSAAKAMCENQVGSVIIANAEGEICGMVTDRDLLCNSISIEFDAQAELRQVMETDIVTLSEGSTIDQAITLMKENGIRRLPILETARHGRRRCVGIVTLDDLIAGQFISGKDLSEIVKSQILRRKLGGEKREDTALHKSRLDQSYHRFIAAIATEAELEIHVAEDVAKFVLSSIVKRLHYTGGAHMIAQLPKKLQEELLDLPAGPDRSITGQTFSQGVSLRTETNLAQSEEILNHVWTAFRRHIGSESADHVLHQLPEDLRRVLEPGTTEYIEARKNQPPLNEVKPDRPSPNPLP